MYTLMLCVATAAVGIDVGWERMPEGGMEYIIQLDPQTLEALRAGVDIRSEILPGAGEVRGYRIIVGGKKLPRETPPTPKTMASKDADRKEPQPTAPHALTPDLSSKPLLERTAAYTESQRMAAAAKPQPKTTPEAQPEKPATPWLLTLLGLFASLGVNVYLGWIAWDARQRWKALRAC